MKVRELLENVVHVDFARARANIAQRADQLERDDAAETQSVQELAQFEEWMVVAKKKGRIPGFETMDDALAFLLADAELPQRITRESAIEWFSGLNEDEKEKVQMICYHADRMIQIYDILQVKIHGIQDTWHKRFRGNVPKGWDAIDGAAWLDQEFTYDKRQLNNLRKALELLGR